MNQCFASNSYDLYMVAPEANSNRNQRRWSNQGTSVQRIINPIVFIGLEMSFVPQVERVFVDASDNGREFQVTVVINERNPNVRSAVYKREQSIMDEICNSDFDFHILARE